MASRVTGRTGAAFAFNVPGMGIDRRARRRARGVPRAARLARRLRVLAAVIRDPGLNPSQLAARAGVSESTLFRDLRVLRRDGYAITYRDGYQLQESLGLDGPNPATGLGAVYERQLALVHQQLPAGLAGQVQAELEAEAPAALAAIVATVIDRQLALRGSRSTR
jgi:predicted DNA-binding transcriptional regulator YafY